ncbi:MAG: PAS domain S-box protein [Candidatus Competibacteraceae bacterium]
MEAVIQQNLEGAISGFNVEFRMRTKGGDWKWINGCGDVTERDAAGKPLRMGGTNMDISQRKRSEEALQESEARFRDISAMASDWFWEQDAQFRFTFFSHGETMYGLDQLGIGPRQLLGKTRWELPISLTADQWAEHRAVLEAHQPFRDFEYPIRTVSGECRWFTINGRPLFGATGQFIGYRGTGRDITERKHVEEKLRQSRNLLQTVLDSIPVRVFWKDLHLRYLGCNQAFARDAGVSSPADMLGKDDYQFSWLEQADLYRSDDKAVLARQSQDRLRRAADDPRWPSDLVTHLQDSVARRGWRRLRRLGTYQDITERRQAEEALQFTQFAMDRASDSVLWVNDEGELICANDAACASVGYTREGEMLRMKIFDIDPDFPPDRFEEHKAELQRRGAVTFESRHRTKDGRLFPVEVTGSTNYKGRFLACAFDQDITERKQAEMELQRHREHLEELVCGTHTTELTCANRELRKPCINWCKPKSSPRWASW